MAMNEGTSGSGFKAGVEIGPDGKPTGDIICYPSEIPNCKVVRTPEPGNLNSGFCSLPTPTHFHDGLLIEATQEINKVLGRIIQETKGNKRGLHVYLAPEGPMLIWSEGMAMASDDIRKGSRMKTAA
jgi:hypothetical protein